MRTFEQDLEKAVAYHGHLCNGQILGVRMTRLALRHLGIEQPETYRDLIAYVEADRCIADAVCCIAHCNLGRRRLKWFDYGKMAATLVDIGHGNRAVRVNIKGDFFPAEGEDPLAFFAQISDEELFGLTPVRVEIAPEDLPGKPQSIVTCQQCGEKVFDHKQKEVDGRILCQSCAHGGYYTVL